MQPMAGVPKRLTEKQLKFARLYVLNEGRMTATECAIEAGYTKDQEAAYATASRLLNEEKSPLVAQEIGKLRAEMQKKYDDTPFTLNKPQAPPVDPPPPKLKNMPPFDLQNLLDSISEQMKASKIKPEDLENMDLEEILKEIEDEEEITIIDDDRLNSEDYGTSYSDWSPDPEDYLT